MSRLFPGGLEEKQALIERARELLGPARRDETPLRTIKRISSRPAAADGEASLPPAPALPDAIPPSATVPVEPAKARASRWHPIALAGAAAALGLALGVLAVSEPEAAAERNPPPDRSASASGRAGEASTGDRGAATTSVATADPGVTDAASPDAGADMTFALAELEPAADPQTMGFVNVVTRGGWAEVRHGGRSYGPTPVRVRLPVGRRRLTIVPRGHDEPRHVEVDVDATEAVRVVVPLSNDAR